MNASTAGSPTDPSARPHEAELYRHASKPKWGLAILAWSKPDRRGYQFEDGKLRILMSGYYAKLEPVDLPHDEKQAMLRRLGARLGWPDASERATTNRHRKPIRITDQIAYFRRLYPEGFESQAWLDHQRVDPSGKRLKRHRDHVIELAQQRLSRESLDASLAAGDGAAILESMQAILAATNLVTQANTRPLTEIPPDQSLNVATALRALLHAEDGFGIRFEHFVVALSNGGKQPSWELVTVLPALFAPDTYAFVRPTLVSQQASWMTPGLKVGRTTDALTYERINDMFRRTATSLTEAGCSPRDLLDVADFIAITLHPKALEEIRAATAD